MPDCLSFTVITPLWNRPKLLPGFIQMIKSQDYPRDKFTHLLLDDSGQYENQRGEGWQLISFNRPMHSLPAKYNAILGMIDTDAFAICEDDDLYLPHMLNAHNDALRSGQASKPSKVLVQYGTEHVESDPGRFHASIALRTDFARKIGGWPLTSRADFDLQFIARIREATQVIDSTPEGVDPWYVFRWETTGHTHAQAYGSGPLDENYLAKARAAAGPIDYVGCLFG